MYEQGEVLFMRIPYKNPKSRKIEVKPRPVVVVSKNKYNSTNNSLIVCSITKVIRNWNGALKIDNESMKNGYLPLESELRVDMINNIHKTEILKSMGFLKD